jgi:hypothetical protein
VRLEETEDFLGDLPIAAHQPRPRLGDHPRDELYRQWLV